MATQFETQLTEALKNLPVNLPSNVLTTEAGNAVSATKATQDGNNRNIVETYATKEELTHVGGGVSIGTIFLAPYTTSWTPEGAVLADGTQYTADQFKQFYDEFLVTGRVMTCTYSQFKADVAKSGGCAKFGIDTSKRTFKVPKIGNGTFVQGGDGTAYEAGLPNIKGELSQTEGIFRYNPTQGSFVNSGALKNAKTRSYAWTGYAQNSGNVGDINFDASLSNPIYGKSTTVQPKAVSMRFYVQLANGSTNQSQMDWARYMEGLNSKANISDVYDRVTINNMLNNWQITDGTTQASMVSYAPVNSRPLNVNPGIPQGTYTVMNVLSRLIKMSHTHSKGAVVNCDCNCNCDCCHDGCN